MPETITVQIREPQGDDEGQVTIGYYVIQDGMLTMTDPEGQAVIGNHGRFEHQLKEGDRPRAIAVLLTRDVRRHMRGETREQEQFRRKINYPRAGIV